LVEYLSITLYELSLFLFSICLDIPLLHLIFKLLIFLFLFLSLKYFIIVSIIKIEDNNKNTLNIVKKYIFISSISSIFSFIKLKYINLYFIDLFIILIKIFFHLKLMY